MFRTVIVIAAVLLTGPALAAAVCAKHPNSEWLPEAEAKSRIEAQGYKIKKFTVVINCYKIHGTNKDGTRVAIYFDTKTLEVVKYDFEN